MGLAGEESINRNGTQLKAKTKTEAQQGKGIVKGICIGIGLGISISIGIVICIVIGFVIGIVISSGIWYSY